MSDAEVIAVEQSVGDSRGGIAVTTGGHATQAVLYLRVSTPSQVNTDYNPEGISLPAQREACVHKADLLDAEIVREFVEPGRSAATIDKRPVFQEMMAWIKEQGDIDYVVVYHFNRMFRNSIDAALTKRDMRKLGVRVVSTIIDLGDGPEGDMVETILNAVDEYRSRADGADISYKMGAKARSGGTLGRAPLGYLNFRDTSEGRNIGTVIFDPERSDLVRAAFDMYSTGDFSLESLADELTRRGLRTRSGRYPGGPVSTSKLAELLHDQYYIGYVTYKGELIKGRHDALISDDLYERVQAVLNERRGQGLRQRRHPHYLKGALWCDRCHAIGIESRMYMQWAKGNGGRYRYFFCGRKQHRQCDSSYLEDSAIEAAILKFYGTISFPSDLAGRVREMIHEALDERERSSKLLHGQLMAELGRLDKQEENLLDLASDGQVPTDKIKQRLVSIQRQRAKVQQRSEQTGEQLELGAELLESALLLLERPQDLYAQMGPEQRRLLNQAIFEKLYVSEEDDGVKVTGTFNAPFGELLDAREHIGRKRRTASAAATFTGSTTQNTATLVDVFSGRGSKSQFMVGTKGLEPSLEAF